MISKEYRNEIIAKKTMWLGFMNTITKKIRHTKSTIAICRSDPKKELKSVIPGISRVNPVLKNKRSMLKNSTRNPLIQKKRIRFLAAFE